ncbi:methyl-accepting chemotaxis protein [Agathobacter rectalis]|uniref:methyl-accepting chemotaxis protein n=1 Tax=Agathobacter rectalis TaxID=39491 RepID=UPI00269BAC07|nr:methyl-accepting chemotaxis protein [Agathobacter rectalis]
MEEKRAPLSEMAIERKIQILRNKHMDSEVIALVKSDYEYGLTDDEIGLYLNKSYDIEQMKVLSKCLHKGVSEELLTLLKDSRMAAPKMQTVLDYYEKGVPIDAIREVVQKDDTAVNMRRMFDVVLEKLNKAKEQMPQDLEYVKSLVAQMDEVVAKINHQNERYDALNKKLSEIENLAEAAQSLAEGATDQAASVEEMQATINELTSGIKTTAEELGTAYDEAYKYAEIAEGSRGDMEVLVQAMSRINETSEKIGAIITQIEDIASQTNLLSLNASIEAARAGEAGKGFAVVADQIRNLAEQSAKSAVDSKALIEAAIHEVGDGNMYAEKASTSLREVVDGIQAIADSAKKIKEISIEQADSMEQVEATAERIAEVVQNNSAAAQETSATSEELTAQATTLSGMVSVFKLRQ